MILIISFVFFTTYTILALTTLLSLFLSKTQSFHQTPTVSVIIPAHNEEKYLLKCLNALLQLNYPMDKLEIILINDRSTDRTETILKKYTQQYSHMKMVTISQKPVNKTGKIQALMEGVKVSRGEWIFFTDADCVVPSTWINSMLNYQQDGGMIGAPILIQNFEENETLFSRVQALDWIYFCAMGSAWSQMKMPLSIFGNNMAIRRDVYQKAGGFKKVKNHITEDFALMRNIKKIAKTKIQLFLYPGMMVQSFACTNWLEFFKQRSRWAAGSKDRGFLTYFLMIIYLVCHLLSILLMVLVNIKFGLCLLLGIFLFDGLILTKSLIMLKKLHLILWYIPYKMYTMIYPWFFIPTLLFKKTVTWKSDQYGI